MTTNRMGLTPEQSIDSFSDATIKAAIGVVETAMLANAFRELLAYRVASKEPVAWKWRLNSLFDGEQIGPWRMCLSPMAPGSGAGYETEAIPLYAAPPIQAVTVPDSFEIEKAIWDALNRVSCPPAFMRIATDACRAAMLRSVTNEP